MMNGITNKLLVFFILSGFAVASCRKKELPVTPPAIGDVTTTAIELSPSYQKIAYFDLGTNTNAGEAVKTNWDLGFSCAGETPYIILNAAKIMLAAPVTGKTFEQVTSTSNLSFKAEHPTGRMDSLAIRGGSVYVLDRGYDNSGTHMGHFKMEILEHTNLHFKGRFAKMDGSNEQTVTIEKDNNYNFVYMKWNESGTVNIPVIEPLKDTWDLVFTQYSEIFHEPEYMPYSVVGCLTNTYNTTALRVTDKAFEDINLEYAENLILSNDRDEIGYDWKTFLYDQNIYQIHYEKVYVVKDSEGYFYKLRFIDFYNQIGEKGTPTFEYQRL
ncbi:hypothetical protein G5B10_15385 [Fluviicola sp. SGL-29]|nr:hypothetical protein [Fluviicola sp. SGL-29]